MDIAPRLDRTALYAPSELMQRWRTLSALSTSGKCRVGCIGLLKAGKSSLCNALTDSWDDQLFAVGANRTTTTIQHHEAADYVLLDTPGLDCNDNDTRETLSLLESLDIILFIHNLNTGELDREERLFLESMTTDAKRNNDFMRKTFWVLSKLDECNDHNTGVILQDKIAGQITAIMGEPPNKLFCVASTRYKKGMAQSKNLLVQASHIPELKQQLHAALRQQKKSIAQVRQNALDTVAQEIIAGLQRAAEHKMQAASQIETFIDASRLRCRKSQNSLIALLDMQLQKYKEL